jgi:hypothetical protein
VCVLCVCVCVCVCVCRSRGFHLHFDVDRASTRATESVQGGGSQTDSEKDQERESERERGGSDSRSCTGRTITRDRIKLLGIYCQMAKPEPIPLELKVTEDGPPHSKTFTVDAIVDGTSRAVVSASKKKTAQMQAASKALEELKVNTAELVQQYLATLPPKRRRVNGEGGQGGAGGAGGVKMEGGGEEGADAGDEDEAKDGIADGAGVVKGEGEGEGEEEEEECVDAEGGAEEEGGQGDGDGAADAS